MAYNDNTAQQPGYATAREFQLELGGFTQQLREAAKKLQGEIDNIESTKTQIKEELDDTCKTFVKNTLTDISGPKFQEISAIAQEIPQLGAQSLAFTAKKMTDSRDAALTTINASLTETIDAETFEDRYAKAKDAVTAAQTKGSTAAQALETAQDQQSEWHQSKDYAFVALDKEITKNGGVSITPDNRSYYEPKGFISKIVNYLKNGSEYRKVRKALKAYGHGVGGKDAFADLAGFKQTDAAKETAISNAQTDAASAGKEQAAAEQLVQNFAQVAPHIKTDAEILAAVQDKVTGFFSTPEFVDAMSKKYGEDFPRGIALMTAKIESLDKLEQGVQEKLETANANYLAASKQYTQLSKMKPNTQINHSLDDLRKSNRARIQEYDNYATAANQGWTRVRSYNPPTTVVYVDNSPSFFEMMLWADMMNSNRNYDRNYAQDFRPDPVSSYSADLMGIQKDQATAQGLPATLFDTSPQVQQQMADIGVNDYKTGSYLFDTAPAAADGGNISPSVAPAAAGDSLFDTAIQDATPAYTPSPSYGGSDYSRPAPTSNDNGLFDTAPAPRSNYGSNDYTPSPTPSWGGGGSGS